MCRGSPSLGGVVETVEVGSGDKREEVGVEGGEESRL